MIFLRNVNISAKISVLLLVSACFLGMVGLTSYVYIERLKESSELMYRERLLPVKLLNEMRNNNRLLETYTLELMLTIKVSTHKELGDKIREKTAENERLMAQYEQTGLDPAEKKLLDRYKELLPTFLESREKVVKMAGDNRKLEAYTHYLDYVKQTNEEMNAKLLDGLVTYKQKAADELTHQNLQDAENARLIMIVATIAAIVLFLLFGAMVSRSITKPLRMLQGLMGQAQTGDLRVQGHYVSTDEVGRVMTDFNGMIEGIRRLVSGINDNAGRLSAHSAELAASTEQSAEASNQIAAAVQDVSHGAEIQHHRAEEASRAMKEVGIEVERIAQASATVTHSSQEAALHARYGNETLAQVVAQIKSIESSVGASAGIVRSLGERSEQISHIVEVIAAISNQTNLLALNAAIEAARAGEHGKGFSVVAGEVRKLAEQSAASSSMITELIQGVQQDTLRAVHSMDAGNRDVAMGIAMVDNAEKAFAQILHATHEVSDQIQAVSASVKQIAAGTKDILHAIAEVEQIATGTTLQSQSVVASSQEQLASIEAISASTHSLSQMAHELEELASQFKM